MLVAVFEGVAVYVSDAVCVCVLVAVFVGVAVYVSAAVCVCVCVTVADTVSVSVSITVGVSVGVLTPNNSPAENASASTISAFFILLLFKKLITRSKSQNKTNHAVQSAMRNPDSAII